MLNVIYTWGTMSSLVIVEPFFFITKKRRCISLIYSDAKIQDNEHFRIIYENVDILFHYFMVISTGYFN